MRRPTAMAALVLWLVTAAAFCPDALPGSEGQTSLPAGSEGGTIESRWIAPFVLTTRGHAGPAEWARTVWFDERGAEIESVPASGWNVVITADRDGTRVAIGTQMRWRVALPVRPASEVLQVSGDGRTLVCQRDAPGGTRTADVWIDGKSRGALGPIVPRDGACYVPGYDGSIAFIGRPTQAGPECRVKVWAPSGEMSIDATCGAKDDIAGIAPNGQGALLRRRTSGTDTLVFCGKSSTARPIDVGERADLLAWVGGETKGVFSCSRNGLPRLVLVDLSTGSVGWDVENPLGSMERPGAATIVEEGLLLLSGADEVQGKQPGSWSRRIAALDAATGRPVATWRSRTLHSGWVEPLLFMRRTGRLYVVAREEFGVIDLDDARHKAEGWQ